MGSSNIPAVLEDHLSQRHLLAQQVPWEVNKRVRKSSVRKRKKRRKREREGE